MGNAHGQQGDPHRKISQHGNAEGLVFGAGTTQGTSIKYGRDLSYEQSSGPVDVTKPGLPGVHAKPAAHRPRSTTESGPRRHMTIDIVDKEVDKQADIYNTNARFVSSVDSPQKKMPTIIKYHGVGREVFVCGSFNHWQKMRMSRSQKDFVAMVDLGEGDHEYKFYVDGVWTVDPNTQVVETSDGIKNNKIHVQKEDFDAYDALDMDLAAVAKSQLKTKSNIILPQSAFGQEAPAGMGYDSNQSTGHQGRHHAHGPPILPPHLLQVILNKDTPMSCEPTLLPEPNHVMLNHLYALSIKDGVMVLSATQRFKKKYVTTLLYKPMGIKVPE